MRVMNDTDPQAQPPRASIAPSVLRGLLKRCPQCGGAPLFRRYLKPADGCRTCGAQYGEIRTDDFAPWLTIMVIGHIAVPAIWYVERFHEPPMWFHLAVTLPLVVGALMAFLPHAKGICMGLMWALRLRGDETQ